MNNNNKSGMAPGDMIRLGIFLLIVAICCFLGGQSLIGTGSRWTVSQADLTNGARLVYASYVSVLVGVVFLLAGLIKQKD